MRRAERAVCVVLHDVAPTTWPACRVLLDAVDSLGTIPLTLLVVPEYHHGGPVDAAPSFVRAVEARLARGDEVAMHGCFHWDDVPATTPSAWLMRRVYTVHEGEFAALDEVSARRRLARGIATFRRLGWPLGGFVAPAWLLNEGARAALSSSPFSYTSTRRHLHTLPDWRTWGTESLVWSVRSLWRRMAFAAYNRYLLRSLDDAPLLRLGLHPVDAAHADVVAFWLATLRASLATRVPMTKRAWIAAASC